MNTQLVKTPLAQSPSDRQHPIPVPYPMGRAVSGDDPDTAQTLPSRMPLRRSWLAGIALFSGRLSTNRVSATLRQLIRLTSPRSRAGEVSGAGTRRCHRAVACCQLLSSPVCGNSPPCPLPEGSAFQVL